MIYLPCGGSLTTRSRNEDLGFARQSVNGRVRPAFGDGSFGGEIGKGMQTVVYQKIFLMAGLSAMVITLGCQSFKPKPLDTVTSIVKKQEEYPITTPVKVVAFWKEATLENSNGHSIRGFAGRVYFFDQKEQAVKVDGQLVVYGFDDSNESQQRETPDKKFIIERDGLASKYSVSDVGPSYSIWLPWDEVGGLQKDIALVTMFKSADGAVVHGEASKNTLPGKQQPHIAERESLLKELQKSIRNVDRSTDVGAKAEGQEAANKLNTTTIPLSPNMQERLESSENRASFNPAFPGVVIPTGIVPVAAFPDAVPNKVIPTYTPVNNALLVAPISSTTEPMTQISTSGDKRTGSVLR